ncbi:thiamine phosphate synthase [Paenibacillus sp. SC116]|uniref:thiamine phosphate synthase n=1 Tax=Paenibacillus sp. SC116 TaxID=2968986 RepID=UPI00215A8E45|nr:thiamine phosphate synthase [Paenibacillus sp. SC116]MCR8842799.1 thiamine phosphate synthase [Paenibacillus sp. SC116]
MMIVPWLHVITPPTHKVDEVIRIAIEIADHVDFIHLRQKEWSARKLWEVIESCRHSGIPTQKWIINDRCDVAAAIQAKGVQLAYHSLPCRVVRRMYPQLTVGVSVHNEDEAVIAEQDGADYLLFGHVFETSCKPGVRERGLDGLQACREVVDIPIIAIGGIKPDHMMRVVRAGGSGVAVMSGIWNAESPEIAARTYREALLSSVQYAVHERSYSRE